jgi:hypothetical protein
MYIKPTIITVKATRDLSYLHIDAGPCPVTGKPRTDTQVEKESVIEFFLAPEITKRIMETWPESKEAEYPEAFQVEFVWID